MKQLICIIIIILCLTGCGYGNLDYIKDRADERWSSMGFEIVGYDGFQWGMGLGTYGGARVWYVLKKSPDNGVLYSGYLSRWGEEIHMYNLRALDALNPH